LRTTTRPTLDRRLTEIGTWVNAHRPVDHHEQSAHVYMSNGPMSVYRFQRRALTHCPQLCMGIQPGASFPAQSADALPATLYGYFTQAVYRNWPITLKTSHAPIAVQDVLNNPPRLDFGGRARVDQPAGHHADGSKQVQNIGPLVHQVRRVTG